MAKNIAHTLYYNRQFKHHYFCVLTQLCCNLYQVLPSLQKQKQKNKKTKNKNKTTKKKKTKTRKQKQKTKNKMLGSKTLGTNVLELQFVLCWQTMIKTQSLGLGLLKVCFFVKLESSDCRTYWTKSARLDRSKIRLDQSNHVQIYFSTEFQFNTNST